MGGGGGVPPGGSGAPAHPPHRYSVAPMLECTDRHFRFLARLLTKRTQLWTEMVKDDAVIHAEDKILASSACEQPVVLQLGGHEPERLALATRAAARARWPYYEVNLNCGCPSERVQTFSFGAVLMLNAKLAGECMAAIGAALPTDRDMAHTVKCRLGVDDMDSYEELLNFVDTVHDMAGVTRWYVHSRKCLLHGLSPHQNRTVPPLRYEWVYRLARERPQLEVILNGGVRTNKEALEHLARAPIAGVMLGRAAYHTPWDTLASADWEVFGEPPPPEEERTTRRRVIATYCEYGDAQIAEAVAAGGSPGEVHSLAHSICKPVKELFANELGKRWFGLSVHESLCAWREDAQAAKRAGLSATPGHSITGVLEKAMRDFASYKWCAEALDSPAGLDRDERRRRRKAVEAAKAGAAEDSSGQAELGPERGVPGEGPDDEEGVEGDEHLNLESDPRCPACDGALGI